MIGGMETKRTSNRKPYWFAVGVVSDKLIRDLKEIERRKRLLDAFQRAQECGAGTPNTAPEIRGNPRRTTNDGPTGESGVGGRE